MRNITSTMQFLAVILVLTLVVGAVYAGIFLYIKNTNKEITELTKVIDEQIQIEEKLRSIESVMEDTIEGRAKLDSYFVGQNDIVQFIETIEALSGITGEEVTIISVDIQEDDNTSAYQFLRLRLTTRGAWEETIHFIALLETLPNYVVIERAGLDLRFTDEEAGEWRSSFDIKVAMLK